MAWILSGTNIKAPQELAETNSTQMAQVRTLSGAIARDYFGSNKRVWEMTYSTVSKANYDVIKAIYDTYLTTGTAVSWSVTETNYAVSSTTVHIDLQERSFSYKGDGYLSDFTLTLTEA